MYQLEPKGTPTFGIFEVGLAKLPEDGPAALGVVPDPKVMGRQTLVSWPMYQLKPKGTPAFGIFEIALAKLSEDEPAALGVVPVPKVMGRPWHHGVPQKATSMANCRC